MCKEKELTEAAYRYYVDEACIEDIAKQLHRSYNYTRLIIKKYRGAFWDAIIMHWLEREKKLQAVADEYFNGTMTTEQIKETFHVSGDTVREVAQKQKPPFTEKPEFTPEESEKRRNGSRFTEFTTALPADGYRAAYKGRFRQFYLPLLRQASRNAQNAI